MLLLVLVTVSYEDYRKRIIQNKYVVLIFFMGMFYQFLNTGTLPLRTFLYFGYALIVGFAMWFLGLWPAGDAKLFSVLVMFLPETFLRSGIILTYSINIFVPIFIVLTVFVMFKGRDKIKEGLKYAFNPYRVFILMVILLGFVGWIVQGLSGLGVPVNFFLILLILFVAFEIFNMIPTFRTELVFTALAVLRIILDFETVSTIGFFKEYFSMIGLFIILRFFVIFVVYHFYGRYVEIEELEPGMSPSEGIVKTEDGFEKVSFMNSSFVDYMRQRKEDFIHNIIELTEEDVEKLKELREDGRMDIRTLFIDRTQHFAFMICIGFLITFVLGRDILTYLQTVL